MPHFVPGPPKIISNQTQFGSQGDTVNIECAAFSVPRIDSIVWMFDGKEIDAIHDQVNDNSTKNHTTHTHTGGRINLST